VTAAIDQLSFFGPVHVGDILTVMAMVNDVGRTSLEVGVRVEAESIGGGDRRHTTSAYLVMVALDAEGRPTEVPPLAVDSIAEDRRRRHAQIRRQVRSERIERLRAHD
jgi:acyl-CoA hydrolase